MDSLDVSTLTTFSYRESVLNFLMAMILSLLVRYCYIYFGKGVSNRRQIAHVFPLITMTTFLMIVVIKSSLALSLGLVGALSIIRFRTPIKEPETLGYLFLTIAIGLGLGAERRLITVTLTCIILITYACGSLFSRGKVTSNLLLNVVINNPSEDAAQRNILAEINDLFRADVRLADLRRYDQQEQTTQLTYLVDLKKNGSLAALSQSLREKYPNAEITFVDNNHLSMG